MRFCNHFIVQSKKFDVFYQKSNNSDYLEAFKYPYIEYKCLFCRVINNISKNTLIRDSSYDIPREDLTRYKQAIKFKMID